MAAALTRLRASLRRTSDLTSAVVKYVFLSVAYTEAGAGYQISIRSCHEKLHADKIAAYICDGVGGGGGHAKKAGGKILRLKMQEKYGGKVFSRLLKCSCAATSMKNAFSTEIIQEEGLKTAKSGNHK